MFRRIVGGFALAAVLATGANAQFQESGFTYDGHITGLNSYNYDTFTGNFTVDDPQTGVGTSPFQIFCVDQFHYVGAGTTYNVWVTPLSASDFSNTRVPGGEPNLYAQAAVLADEMIGPDGLTEAQTDNLQYAMWEIMGTTVSSSELNYDATAIQNNKDFAATNWENISLNQWLVITVDPIGGTYQEFLYNTTSRTQESPTPEPGTMAMMATGLVGMAGASFRRRRRNK
ncbi:MAG TPA: PEP-CTERM sorting domain-containing protein [Gemmatimonadales bacterium]|jgi:hypothetical protein